MLVKIHAASLNYRDIAIVKGVLGLGVEEGVVPCSDDASRIIKVGPALKASISGDKVVTHLAPHLERRHLARHAEHQ